MDQTCLTTYEWIAHSYTACQCVSFTWNRDVNCDVWNGREMIKQSKISLMYNYIYNVRGQNITSEIILKYPPVGREETGEQVLPWRPQWRTELNNWESIHQTTLTRTDQHDKLVMDTSGTAVWRNPLLRWGDYIILHSIKMTATYLLQIIWITLELQGVKTCHEQREEMSEILPGRGGIRRRNHPTPCSLGWSMCCSVRPKCSLLRNAFNKSPVFILTCYTCIPTVSM